MDRCARSFHQQGSTVGGYHLMPRKPFHVSALAGKQVEGFLRRLRYAVEYIVAPYLAAMTGLRVQQADPCAVAGGSPRRCQPCRAGTEKAAQLMAAQTADGLPPVQSVTPGANDRRLSVVLPLGSPQQE